MVNQHETYICKPVWSPIRSRVRGGIGRPDPDDTSHRETADHGPTECDGAAPECFDALPTGFIERRAAG